MSLVANLLRADHIVLDLQVSSKKRLFEQAGLLFENHHGLARSLVFDSLFARERLGSTGLGQGVAIPHGRIKGLKEALGAFLRLSQPVPFDAPDGNPVSLVFVLLVPEKATEKHLHILSELAQMFSDKALREAMSSARSEEHTSELQSQSNLVCRLLLEKKQKCIRERIYVRSLRFDLAALAPAGEISRGQPAFDLGPRAPGPRGGPARSMALEPSLLAQA